MTEAFKKERSEGVTMQLVVKGVRLGLDAGDEEGCLLVGSVPGQGKSATFEALGDGETVWKEEWAFGGEELRTVHFEVLRSTMMCGMVLAGGGALSMLGVKKGQEYTI